MRFRRLLSGLYEEILHKDERIALLEEELESIKQETEDCKLLLTTPGIELLTATALLAAIGDPRVFKNGRELAAWLGLTLRQHSRGGKQHWGKSGSTAMNM
nr:MAG: Transposase IS116/IS110/IS902 family protein [Candidatus Kentron sp. TC]VFK65424.1 MAG: Transposase IS116/IS110/IS902 family protein [Candidatus Kentron sp. TC]